MPLLCLLSLPVINCDKLSSVYDDTLTNFFQNCWIYVLSFSEFIMVNSCISSFHTHLGLHVLLLFHNHVACLAVLKMPELDLRGVTILKNAAILIFQHFPSLLALLGF